jgi:hypothetical protein
VPVRIGPWSDLPLANVLTADIRAARIFVLELMKALNIWRVEESPVRGGLL